MPIFLHRLEHLGLGLREIVALVIVFGNIVELPLGIFAPEDRLHFSDTDGAACRPLPVNGFFAHQRFCLERG